MSLSLRTVPGCRSFALETCFDPENADFRLMNEAVPG